MLSLNVVSKLKLMWLNTEIRNQCTTFKSTVSYLNFSLCTHEMLATYDLLCGLVLNSLTK